MHVLCPQCQNRIVFRDESTLPDEVQCPTCGSGFRLAHLSTEDYQGPLGRQVAGKFELLSVVGHGAFGTVFKARDHELGRTVAVKMPRSGPFTDAQAGDRFVREARNVAQLRHPAIVPVHEVGQEDGLPFLVSDFIDGMSLADYLTGRRLPFVEAAELTATVADALQYAHDQGVIHRDVKPSNILLDSHNRPYLVDFGLAKRDAGEITMTLDGQVLGTPAFMSPEQAKEAHQVDGRSDVYSLGAVLYLLLTGELPFRGNTRMLLHQVLHDEPRPPRSLNDRIPRDLETICLKCLHKEPHKRYATAKALADDLRRFLAGQPIQARPVGRFERFWRWCRRKPAVAGLSAALILVIPLGFAGVFWKWREAQDQHQQAEKNLAAARQNEIEAEENFREALKAVEDYFTIVSEDKLLNSPLPGLQPLRKDLLGSALKYYQRFTKKHANDPKLRFELAMAYYRMGAITRTIGSQEEGLKLLQKAADFLEEMPTGEPEDFKVRQGLARTYTALGTVQAETNRLANALDSLQKALTVQTTLTKENPKDMEGKYRLALIHNLLGLTRKRLHESEKALGDFATAIHVLKELGPEHPHRLKYQSLLAAALVHRGNIQQAHLNQNDKALQSYQEAKNLLEKLTRDFPHDIQAQSNLATCLHNLGAVYDNLNQTKQAMAFIQQSLNLWEKLARDNPTVTDYQTRYVSSCRALAHLFNLTGQTSQALSYLHKILGIQKQLVQENPTNTELRQALAEVYNTTGTTHQNKQEPFEAALFFRLAQAEQSRLAQENPQNLSFQFSWAVFQANVASIEMNVGRPAEAIKLLQEVAAIHEKLASEKYKGPGFAKTQKDEKTFLKVAQKELAKMTAKQKTVKREIDELVKQLEENAEDDVLRGKLAKKRHEHGQILRSLGPFEAVKAYQQCLEPLQMLVEKYPIIADYRHDLVSVYLSLGYLHGENERVKEAMKSLHHALPVLDKVAKHTATDLYLLACVRAQFSGFAGRAYLDLSAEEQAQRKKHGDQAMEALRQALAAGFKDHARLQQELYLDPLRHREDFQQVLAQEKKK